MEQSTTPLIDQVKQEIGESLQPVFAENEEFRNIFNNICEPDLVLRWKAVWEDDNGKLQVNTCWRVQQNNALGTYKGGTRLDPSVTFDVLGFLALEQTFKNALTGKPMGGSKGGSDFDPKGKSDSELRRFCFAFMLGLQKVIGPQTDVPGGDIGVGSKVIGMMVGAWKKLGHDNSGIFTSKSKIISGLSGRESATGFGVIYLLLEHLTQSEGKNLEKRKVLISGAGNVAIFCAKKAISNGATVLSLSDRKQTFWCEAGMTESDVDAILNYKNTNSALPDNVKSIRDNKPWKLAKQADIAIPCATQNEIDDTDAEALVKAGCKIVIEGSNLSSTSEAVEIFKKHSSQLDYIGSKLANLGGVATSFLEMMQNSGMANWEFSRVDEELQQIMTNAYKLAADAAAKYSVSLTDGANIAAFLRVAEAMKEQGWA